MRLERPPAVPTWILERFCANEALAGDLIEEYGCRRSAFWYWRQALGAATVFAAREIVEHKWLAVRAIATGWAIWFVCNDLVLRGVVRPWMDTLPLKTAYLLIMYALWLANGWMIARLHRPYQTAMVLAYVMFALVASVPSVYQSAMDALNDPAAWTALAWNLSTRALTIFSLIIGGLLSTSRPSALVISPPLGMGPDIVAGWGL